MSNLESVSVPSSRTNHPFTDGDQAVMAQVRAMVEPNKGKAARRGREAHVK
jgi:hypothetical protein